MRQRSRLAVFKPRTFSDKNDEDWINCSRYFEDVVAADEWASEITRLALSASMTGAAASAVPDIQYRVQAPDVT